MFTSGLRFDKWFCFGTLVRLWSQPKMGDSKMKPSIRLEPLDTGLFNLVCAACGEVLKSDVTERGAYTNAPVAHAHYEAKHSVSDRSLRRA